MHSAVTWVGQTMHTWHSYLDGMRYAIPAWRTYLGGYAMDAWHSCLGGVKYAIHAWCS